MEVLGGLLIIALLCAIIIIPIVILVQLSSIKKSINEIAQENKRLRSILKNMASSDTEDQRSETGVQMSRLRPASGTTPRQAGVRIQQEQN